LDQRLILDPEIFDFVLAFGKFDGDTVTLIFDGFLFSQENVSMNHNFLFSFLHAHFQLVFFVLKAIDVVSRSAKTFLDLFYLQLHDIMLNEHLFFLFLNLAQILDSHVIFKRQLLDLGVQFFLRPTDLVELIFDSPQIVIQLFHTFVEDLELVLDICVFFAGLLDVLLEVLLFFQSSFSSGSRNFTFHELNLVLCVIE
jgi:hypothetical protein